MKKDKTELIFIIDNSGSMMSIVNDMEPSIETLLQEQAALNGECNVTYFSFSNHVKEEFSSKPIKTVNKIGIKPSGSTALFDAIGTAIDSVGNRLAKLPESERPELVVVCSITDGMENASREYNQTQIKEKIKHQQDKYNWQFIFLGANQDAWSNGQSMGVSAGKSMTYATNSTSITGAYKATSDMISTMRCLESKVAANNVDFSVTDRENSVK